MKTLPLGAVVALADLRDCARAETIAGRLQPADLAAGNFAKGRFAWRLENVRRLDKPIPLVGRQGLFNWSPPHTLQLDLLPAVDHAAACRFIGWGDNYRCSA
jgi:hypothetical protein